MPPAPVPATEEGRLRALHALGVLDSAPEEEFDALVNAAALVCGVPISLISLVDHDRQWFKANVGLVGVTQTPREVAFCAHAIGQDDLLEVVDARADERFADNPLVLADPNIRFYAGAPLRLSSTGDRIGTLCVIDRTPRHLTDLQRQVLHQLARAAAKALESRQHVRKHTTSEARFRALVESSPLGVFATDAKGACTYTNARWQSIYGLNAVESLGDGWARTLHPDDQARVFAQWQGAAAQGIDFDAAFRLRRPEGSVVSVRAVARQVTDVDGSIVGFVGSVEDVTQRLLTQQALDEERKRLRSIVESTDAGTWEWNVQTGEVIVNARWANLLGWTQDELGPMTQSRRLAWVHPDDVEPMQAALREHFFGQSRVYVMEIRLRHRQGHWLWVEDRGGLMTSTTDGKPEWMFGIKTDITMRRAQAEALRKSQHLLAQTGALADVGGWELDLAVGRPVWSDQTCTIHGVAPGYQPTLEEAIAFYAPEAQPIIQAAVSQSMTDGKPWDLELPLVQSNGERIWVRAVGKVEFDDGKPARLVGGLQNITQRVQQRLQLEAANARLALANDSGGIGVWDYDLASGTLTWDPCMYRLYGLPESTTTGAYELWAHSLHPEDRQVTEQALQDAIAGRQLFNPEFRVVWPDGSIHHIRSAARVTRAADGTALRMVGVNFDITERKQMEEELRRSNAELEQFAYVASHDLQEPLRMVASYSELLAQKYQGQLDARADKYIHYAVDGARRMQRLVADLLAFSRVTSQRGALESTSADKVMRQVLHQMKITIAENDVQISAQPLPHVMANRTQLGQVFQNLISNAIKFKSTRTPEIHIDAARHAGRWVIAVRDNGIGFDMRFAERIFQMFQRLHGRDHYEGSGIGLAIVKRIIEQHGGRIWVESEIDKGTTFFFSLQPVQRL